MMMLRLLHIPVYAERFDVFVAKRQDAVQRRIQEAAGPWSVLGVEMPDEKRQLLQYEVEEAWGDWDVRRVVGWIQLTICEGELELHVFRFKGKQFARNGRLVYERVADREASLGTGHLDRQDPVEWLLNSVEEIRKLYFNRRRWVDRESLKVIATHTRWGDLMRESLTNGE